MYYNLYYFNKGIVLLYYRKNKILIFFKQLRYELGACKNNSRSLMVKLNNKFPRCFLLISCYQVPRVHLKNLLKFQVSEIKFSQILEQVLIGFNTVLVMIIESSYISVH